MPRPRGSSGCRRGHLLASWILRLELLSRARANRPAIYSASYRTELGFGSSVGFRSLRQLRDGHAESGRQPDDVAPARVAPPVLHMADPRLNEAGGLGDLHLTEAALSSDGMDGTPQGVLIGQECGHGYSRHSPLGGSTPCLPSSVSGSRPSRARILAADNLRHPLVAHAHDPGNGSHGQTVAVRHADGLVPLLPQFFASLLQGSFALRVALGKVGKTASGVRSLAFSSGDLRIV
jgi:hypothetical protein